MKIKTKLCFNSLIRPFIKGYLGFNISSMIVLSNVSKSLLWIKTFSLLIQPYQI